MNSSIEERRRQMLDLLDKTRGETRSVLSGLDPQRIEALDQSLWTFREDSFLPHGREGDALQAFDPIILATSAANPNQAALRVLIDRAPLPEDAASYQRIVLMFDGSDEAALVDARAQWAKARKMGLDVTYWQQDENGAWGKRNV